MSSVPPFPHLQVITTWTRFQLPVLAPEVSSKNETTRRRNEWAKTFMPLVKASGYLYSTWGRIIEHPDQVILVTSWKSRTSLQDFEASRDYPIYATGISLHGKPSQHIVDFGTWFAFPSKQHTSMRTIYFPSPASTQQRAKITDLKGLAASPGGAGYGFLNRKCPQTARPLKGWVDGTQVLGGKKTHVLVWCHFWKDGEREVRFRETARVGSGDEKGKEGGEELGQLLLLDRWALDLRAVGAVAWEEEHCVLERVPDWPWNKSGVY